MAVSPRGCYPAQLSNTVWGIISQGSARPVNVPEPGCLCRDFSPLAGAGLGHSSIFLPSTFVVVTGDAVGS